MRSGISSVDLFQGKREESEVVSVWHLGCLAVVVGQNYRSSLIPPFSRGDQWKILIWRVMEV